MQMLASPYFLHCRCHVESYQIRSLQILGLVVFLCLWECVTSMAAVRKDTSHHLYS